MDDQIERKLDAIHDRITEVGTKVTELNTSIKSRGGVFDRLEALESEARESREFRHKLMGSVAAVSAAVSLGIALLAAWIKTIFTR